MSRPAQVLLVDDSQFVLNTLKRTLEADPQVSVAGMVRSGREALEYLAKTPVDVVLLDMNMPEMDGAETTKRVMESHPTPILLLTAATKTDPRVTDALSHGALEMIQKPGGQERSVNLAEIRSQLVEKILFAASSNVGQKRSVPVPAAARTVLSPKSPLAGRKFDLIIIGVSTGGPSTLTKLLSALPSSFRLPILIVQHITLGYSESLARSLQLKCAIPVGEAKPDQMIIPGAVTIGKTGFHMEVAGKAKLKLTQNPEYRKDFVPAVDALFASAAKNFPGSLLAIVLTGMGNDGTAGARKLREKGHAIIAQDEASSVVWGMPGEICRAGLQDECFSLERICDYLKTLA